MSLIEFLRLIQIDTRPSIFGAYGHMALVTKLTMLVFQILFRNRNFVGASAKKHRRNFFLIHRHVFPICFAGDDSELVRGLVKFNSFTNQGRNI